MEFGPVSAARSAGAVLAHSIRVGAQRWGKGKVKRAIGMGAGLLFKGDGFYITDYRSEGYKKSAKADKPSSSGDSKKKSDSKSSSSSGSSSKPAKKK